MNQPRSRMQPTLVLTRCFHRSRLEANFLTAAYALVLPVLRRPLSTVRAAKRRPTKPSERELSTPTEGEQRA